jgi:hypothetical protein
MKRCISKFYKLLIKEPYCYFHIELFRTMVENYLTYLDKIPDHENEFSEIVGMFFRKKEF